MRKSFLAASAHAQNLFSLHRQREREREREREKKRNTLEFFQTFREHVQTSQVRGARTVGRQNDNGLIENAAAAAACVCSPGVSPMLNGVCLLVQRYGMIMTPRLSKCHLAVHWREGASRLITMTMGTLGAGGGGLTPDTAYEMTGMTFSSNGRLWFPETRTDGRGQRIFVWLLGGPSSHFLHRRGALCCSLTELWVDKPSALTHSPGATAFVSLFECVLFMKWRG